MNKNKLFIWYVSYKWIGKCLFSKNRRKRMKNNPNVLLFNIWIIF